MSKKKQSSKAGFLPIESLKTMSRKRRQAIMDRSAARMDKVRPVVESVMRDIKRNGDKALLKYTEKFDGTKLSPSRIRVSESDIKKAYDFVRENDPKLIPAIKQTLECLRGYHKGELTRLNRGTKQWDTKVKSRRWKASQALKVGQIIRPIDSVGIYVPGGNAALLTSALMGITPAKIAGVPNIVLASPPSRNGDIDPRIIVAADMAGADLIVRAGGAQAIAALAYGTKAVPPVAKIVGPGNVYVASAKAIAASTGLCAIDLPAGPSEIVIIADSSAKAEYVARDMLAQAEHDADASSILVSKCKRLAGNVSRRLAKEFETAEGKKSLARKSLKSYGAIVTVDSMKDAIDFTNEFAPEHLEIAVDKPRTVLKDIRNAGGIFLGNFTAVAMGDYVCPNHILPTGGAARFSSGVNVDTFLKRPSVLEVPQAAIPALDELIETLSKAEGLYEQHGKSVRARNSELGTRK